MDMFDLSFGTRHEENPRALVSRLRSAARYTHASGMALVGHEVKGKVGREL